MTPEELKALKREARSKGTSAARLLELAALGPELSREVAKSQNTPLAVLEKLARNVDVHTRKAVADNPNTPPSLLQKMAGDRQIPPLKAVAANPNTPVHVVQLLAQHHQPTVRAATLRNPKRPPTLLQQLGADASSAVRAAVAGDFVLPGTLLQILLRDIDPRVRNRAVMNINCTPQNRRDSLRDPDLQVRFTALNFTSLAKGDSRIPLIYDQSMLHRLAQDSAPQMRERFAFYLRCGHYDSVLTNDEKREIAGLLLQDINPETRRQADAILKGATP